MATGAEETATEGNTMSNPNEAIPPIPALILAIVFTVMWLRLRKTQSRRR